MEHTTNKPLSKGQLIIIILMLALVAAPLAMAEANNQLQVDLHHIVIGEEDGLLQVREIINVVNRGSEPVVVDETLPEEEQFTFRVGLPFGTMQMSFPDHIDLDNDIVATETGFAYTIPFAPGETELDFFYSVEPHNGPQFLVDKEIIYPTNNIVIIAWDGIGVTGNNIVYEGSVTMGEGAVNSYYWDKPTAGDTMMFVAGTNIAADGQAGSSGSNLERGYRASFHSAGHIRFWYTSPFRGIEPHLFLVVVFGVMSAGTYFYIKGRRQEEEGEAEDETADEEEKFQELLERQQELMTKLTQTEKRFREGEITQEEYDKLYGTYKEKLIKVKMQLKLLSE